MAANDSISQSSVLPQAIALLGVETNNLRNIDACFPLKKLSVVTGVSGSGKSSLVFDTLYSEAYRRYVESLSSFARQYLKALPKPKIREVRQLPPAIAVKQARSGATSRSTVGTMTELTDIIRILFAHLSKIYCLKCKRLVEKDSGSSVARKAFAAFNPQDKAEFNERVLVVAPLAHLAKLKAEVVSAQLEAQGFSRFWDGKSVRRIEDAKPKDVTAGYVVVDRVDMKQESLRRLADSAGLGLKAGRGSVGILRELAVSSGTAPSDDYIVFASGLECCGIRYAEPNVSLFSHNSPIGACETCQGFGFAPEVDWEKVVPDRKSTISAHGIPLFNFGNEDHCYEWVLSSAKRKKLNVAKKTFADFSEAEWEWLRTGAGDPYFDGVDGFFRWLDSKKFKPHYRIHAARYRKYTICPSCHGSRLKPVAMACQIDGQTIGDVNALAIAALVAWVQGLSSARKSGTLAKNDQENADQALMGVAEAIEEAEARLKYLTKIGVGYLTLDRASRTLSGGEMQRINMARCLGSALTDTLYCLDEPTSGLHARDSRNLLEVICELRDQGNTVVVVEHEKTVIDGADYLMEIGPKAGHEGGDVVFAGIPSERHEHTADKKAENSVRTKPTEFLELQHATTHNLQNVSIKVPVAALTTVCGVSGSGKTSLIQHTLFPLLARALGQKIEGQQQTLPLAKSVGPDALIQKHAEVLLMSQASLGRSSRSNIATYLGIFDDVRKLLASEPVAQQLKLMPGSFSFNTPGGRCETCRGLGRVVEDLSFLGEMEVMCPSCNGRRFEEPVLTVRYRGKNLLEMLAMTVTEARAFWHDRPSVARVLDITIDLGLGYVTLGQSTSSFSGGEAQRLKLVEVVQNVQKGGKPSILIFDEPTTGLSDSDVTNLIRQFRMLTSRGHTVIVVEHHLQMIRQGDWMIEVGPEAAARGGTIVYEGPPEALAKDRLAQKQSRTLEFM